MALMVSLNCMVAVTKIPSVAESCFPLERKSLTCLHATEIKCYCGIAAVPPVQGVLLKKKKSHLVSQELIKMSQLVGIGDFPIQRGVPLLRHPCGPADFDGAVAGEAFARALCLRLRGRPRGGSWKTGSIWNRHKGAW